MRDGTNHTISAIFALLVLILPAARASYQFAAPQPTPSCCNAAPTVSTCCDSDADETPRARDSHGVAASFDAADRRCCGPGCTCDPDACPCVGHAPVRDQESQTPAPPPSRSRQVDVGAITVAHPVIQSVVVVHHPPSSAEDFVAVHGRIGGRAVLLQSSVLTT